MITSDDEVIIIPGDKIFIPSVSEVHSGYMYSPFSSEGRFIPFFDSDSDKIKFLGQITPDDSRVFNQSTDPTLSSQNNVKYGDIWVRSDSGSTRAYMYIPPEITSKHVFREIDSYLNGYITNASIGGIWYPSVPWWTRSPYYQNYMYDWMNMYATSITGNAS